MKLTSRPLSQWPLKYRGLCPTPTFQSFKHWSHILYWGSSSQNNNIIIIYNQCKNLKVVSNVSFVKVVYTRYFYTCIDKYFYMSYVPSIFVGGLSSSGTADTADFGVHKPQLAATNWAPLTELHFLPLLLLYILKNIVFNKSYRVGQGFTIYHLTKHNIPC